jgi:hypothetical protein
MSTPRRLNQESPGQILLDTVRIQEDPPPGTGTDKKALKEKILFAVCIHLRRVAIGTMRANKIGQE